MLVLESQSENVIDRMQRAVVVNYSLSRHTVGANKKFTFCFRSTVVLQCDRSSKNGMKFYYGSVVRTVYTVSGWSKYLNIYNRCALYPMLFNP